LDITEKVAVRWMKMHNEELRNLHTSQNVFFE